MEYLDFIKSKIELAKDSGFEIPPDKINPALMPHQRDAVRWALRGGRRGYMCELNSDYFRDACGYLNQAEEEMLAPTLFDFIQNRA